MVTLCFPTVTSVPGGSVPAGTFRCATVAVDGADDDVSEPTLARLAIDELCDEYVDVMATAGKEGRARKNSRSARLRPCSSGSPVYGVLLECGLSLMAAWWLSSCATSWLAEFVTSFEAPCTDWLACDLMRFVPSPSQSCSQHAQYNPDSAFYILISFDSML